MFARDLIEVQGGDAMGAAVVGVVRARVRICEGFGGGSIAAVAFFARCLVCRCDRLDLVIEALDAADLLRAGCFHAEVSFFSIEKQEMQELVPATQTKAS
jgi:hypothetical protein